MEEKKEEKSEMEAFSDDKELEKKELGIKVERERTDNILEEQSKMYIRINTNKWKHWEITFISGSSGDVHINITGAFERDNEGIQKPQESDSEYKEWLHLHPLSNQVSIFICEFILIV